MKITPTYKIDNKAPEKKKKFIQNMFDAIVPAYDLLNRMLSGGIDMIWRINVLLTSLDFSLNMLGKAKKRGSLSGQSIAADASTLPLKDSSFHTATISISGEHTAAHLLQHAQESDDDVIERHIDFYVNKFTLSLGEKGTASLTALMEMAQCKHIL